MRMLTKSEQKKNICFYSALMVYCIKTYQFIKNKWINIFFIFPSFIYIISLAQTAFFFQKRKKLKFISCLVFHQSLRQSLEIQKINPLLPSTTNNKITKVFTLHQVNLSLPQLAQIFCKPQTKWEEMLPDFNKNNQKLLYTITFVCQANFILDWFSNFYYTFWYFLFYFLYF